MKLFTHSHGYIFAFGFNMVERKPASRMICWCDPANLEWEPKASNQAGYLLTNFAVAPEFIREVNGRVIAYQPGRCIELTNFGMPLVWGMTSLLADPPDHSLVA